MRDKIRAIDHHTFTRKPEKKEERTEKIQALGRMFEKAGIYLHEYLSVFEENDFEAQKIAEDIAYDFYAYGLSLQKDEGIDEMLLSSLLSPEDKTQLDEWLLGGKVYQKRLAKLGDDPTEEEREGLRKKLLSTYFKALAGEGHKSEGEKPWETNIGAMQHLQDRTRRLISRAIKTPKRELQTAIFRRGVEKLVTEMKEPRTDSQPEQKQRRLYDTLGTQDAFQDILQKD